MQTRTVLGLSFNTRTLAFAIMQGKTLEHYHTSLFKGAWSEEKKELILTRLKSLLVPNTHIEVALALPYESHTTEYLESILESFTAYLKNQNIAICTYNAQAFHLFCEERQPKSKKVMMQTISELYPIMERLYLREIRNKNKYYMRLFEAVALAHLHSKCLNNYK